MSFSLNRLRQAMRHHLSIGTVLIIALMITMMAMTCALSTHGATPDQAAAPNGSPVLLHNASTTDNPLLLLIAAMSSS